MKTVATLGIRAVIPAIDDMLGLPSGMSEIFQADNLQGPLLGTLQYLVTKVQAPDVTASILKETTDLLALAETLASIKAHAAEFSSAGIFSVIRPLLDLKIENPRFLSLHKAWLSLVDTILDDPDNAQVFGDSIGTNVLIDMLESVLDKVQDPHNKKKLALRLLPAIMRSLFGRMNIIMEGPLTKCIVFICNNFSSFGAEMLGAIASLISKLLNEDMTVLNTLIKTKVAENFIKATHHIPVTHEVATLAQIVLGLNVLSQSLDAQELMVTFNPFAAIFELMLKHEYVTLFASGNWGSELAQIFTRAEKLRPMIMQSLQSVASGLLKLCNVGDFEQNSALTENLAKLIERLASSELVIAEIAKSTLVKDLLQLLRSNEGPLRGFSPHPERPLKVTWDESSPDSLGDAIRAISLNSISLSSHFEVTDRTITIIAKTLNETVVSIRKQLDQISEPVAPSLVMDIVCFQKLLQMFTNILSDISLFPNVLKNQPTKGLPSFLFSSDFSTALESAFQLQFTAFKFEKPISQLENVNLLLECSKGLCFF